VKGKRNMERYDTAIRNAAFDVIEAQKIETTLKPLRLRVLNSIEFMEDSARQIAYDFDVPYLSVKEDLQTELNEWDME
jgi:hypothetical protein